MTRRITAADSGAAFFPRDAFGSASSTGRNHSGRVCRTQGSRRCDPAPKRTPAPSADTNERVSTDAGPRVRRRLVPLLALAVLLGGATLRLVYLDADPDYYAWAGYITDEGRWVAHARELALFGRIVNADWLVHLFPAAPFPAISHVRF